MNELAMIIATLFLGGIISGISQFCKKMGYMKELNPIAIVAVVSIVFGTIFTAIKLKAPVFTQESWAFVKLSFASAVIVYDLLKEVAKRLKIK
jgi:hypothetical protein